MIFQTPQIDGNFLGGFAVAVAAATWAAKTFIPSLRNHKPNGVERRLDLIHDEIKKVAENTSGLKGYMIDGRDAMTNIKLLLDRDSR